MSTKPAYACPDCGGNQFTLTIQQLASVSFEPDDDHELYDIRGDAEWGDETDAVCDCGWSGTLREARSEVETVEHLGLTFKVLAKFHETDTKAANAFMAANPNTGLLCIKIGVAYIAAMDDHGVPA